MRRKTQIHVEATSTRLTELLQNVFSYATLWEKLIKIVAVGEDAVDLLGQPAARTTLRLLEGET